MAKQKLEGFDRIFKVLSDDPEIRVGFSDLNLWADTGIPALNEKLTGDYNRGFLYGTLIGIYGESMSGKSLLLAQTAANEQKQRNAFIVWVDVEGAETDKTEGLKWFQRAGIDTDRQFLRLFAPTFRKALKIMTQYVNMYREAENPTTATPLFVVFDSYSALQTDTMIEQNRGKKDLTQDQGQKARQLGDFVQRVKGMIEGLPILVAGVMHVYMNREEYGPRHLTTGGMKPMFLSRVALKMTRYELTNEKASPHLRRSSDVDTRKDNIGIKTVVEIMKCHYNKPGERLDLEAVYGCGFDKYSGLWDLFIDTDVITSPAHGWYEFIRPDGSKQKFQRSKFINYVDELLTFSLPERYHASASRAEIEEEGDDAIFEISNDQMTEDHD